MNETTFENAKVGDRVWDFVYGWGVIESQSQPGLAKQYPIKVNFSNVRILNFTKDGRLYDEDISPTLFWDEVKIIAPPRPKRKVKKTVEFWVNFYFTGGGSPYSTEEQANDNRLPNRIGPAVKFTHEIEVEE